MSLDIKWYDAPLSTMNLRCLPIVTKALPVSNCIGAVVVVCLFARGRSIDDGGSEDCALLRCTVFIGVVGNGIVSGCVSPRMVISERERDLRAW